MREETILDLVCENRFRLYKRTMDRAENSLERPFPVDLQAAEGQDQITAKEKSLRQNFDTEVDTTQNLILYQPRQ